MDHGAPRNGVNDVFNQRYSTIIQTITVAALFVGGFWAGVISPIQNEIHAIEQQRLTIREHEEFKKRIDDRIQAGEDSLRRALDHNDQNIIRLQGDIVPKSENAQHFQETNERITGVKDQLNTLQSSFSATYNIGDQLKQLQKQIDDLRTHPPVTAPAQATPQFFYGPPAQQQK